MYVRYAIYAMLGEGPLHDFGAAWLGWDARHGTPLAHPDVPGLPKPAEEITRTPRKYGLHGTIKPPFYLTEGTSEDGLRDALASFCAGQTPVTLEGLELARLGGFLALRPTGDQSGLASLAAAAVIALDPFRAPPSEAELARRKLAGLSPAQESNLEAWGYPYVMDEFRFHITLSGRLDAADAAAVEAALTPHITPHLPRPFGLDSLCLLGSDSDGRFHLIDRVSLSA